MQWQFFQGRWDIHEVTRPLVIVLDDDNNLEVLKGRSLGNVDQSILRV